MRPLFFKYQKNLIILQICHYHLINLFLTSILLQVRLFYDTFFLISLKLKP